MSDLTFTYHPITDVFPRMTPHEFADLKQDIKLNGQLVPIVVLGGAVVDGRHRLQACRQLGIAPKIIDASGDPILLAQALNLRRRHLKPDQLAAIFKKLQRDHPALAAKVEAIKANARTAQHAGLKRGASRQGHVAPTGRSAAVIGQLIGTSERTVKRVDQVATVAPEAVDKVAAGTISAAQVLRLRTQNKPSRPRTSAPPSRAAAPSAADPMMSHSTPAAPSSSPPSTGRTLTEMRAELPTAMRQILDELEERVRTLLQLLEGMGAADSHRRCIAELLEHLADRVRNGAGPIRP